jgi:hypothetical protein
MFLNDPSGFMLRCYLPRVYRTLTPLAKLPPLDSMFMGLEALTPLFASPEFQKMAGTKTRCSIGVGMGWEWWKDGEHKQSHASPNISIEVDLNL